MLKRGTASETAKANGKSSASGVGKAMDAVSEYPRPNVKHRRSKGNCIGGVSAGFSQKPQQC
jgi:hypothetical protein